MSRFATPIDYVCGGVFELAPIHLRLVLRTLLVSSGSFVPNKICSNTGLNCSTSPECCVPLCSRVVCEVATIFTYRYAMCMMRFLNFTLIVNLDSKAIQTRRLDASNSIYMVVGYFQIFLCQNRCWNLVLIILATVPRHQRWRRVRIQRSPWRTARHRNRNLRVDIWRIHPLQCNLWGWFPVPQRLLCRTPHPRTRGPNLVRYQQRTCFGAEVRGTTLPTALGGQAMGEVLGKLWRQRYSDQANSVRADHFEWTRQYRRWLAVRTRPEAVERTTL